MKQQKQMQDKTTEGSGVSMQNKAKKVNKQNDIKMLNLSLSVLFQFQGPLNSLSAN